MEHNTFSSTNYKIDPSMSNIKIEQNNQPNNEGYINYSLAQMFTMGSIPIPNACRNSTHARRKLTLANLLLAWDQNTLNTKQRENQLLTTIQERDEQIASQNKLIESLYNTLQRVSHNIGDQISDINNNLGSVKDKYEKTNERINGHVTTTTAKKRKRDISSTTKITRINKRPRPRAECSVYTSAPIQIHTTTRESVIPLNAQIKTKAIKQEPSFQEEGAL